MNFGVAIPTCRDGLIYPPGFCNKNSLVTITKLAEDLGYHSVWGNDHITTQSYLKHVRPLPNYFEVLTSLSFLAAVTTKIKLGTGIVPLPLRNCVLLAKQAATLDNLSDGRLLLGVGIGAYREEFEAMIGRGRRGDMLDEGLEALNLLFQKNNASFSGKYVRFNGIDLNPKPIQKPLPIYVGGNSHEHLRRVAKFGRGWIPAAMPHEKLGQYVRELENLLRENHRSIDEVDISLEAGLVIGSTDEESGRAFMKSPMYKHIVSLKESTMKDQDVSKSDSILQTNFVGSAATLVKKVELYKESGVTTLWFDFIGDTLEDVTNSIRLFAKDVMASF
jgi:probable F420-dependent oxidoreductase